MSGYEATPFSAAQVLALLAVVVATLALVFFYCRRAIRRAGSPLGQLEEDARLAQSANRTRPLFPELADRSFDKAVLELRRRRKRWLNVVGVTGFCCVALAGKFLADHNKRTSGWTIGDELRYESLRMDHACLRAQIESEPAIYWKNNPFVDQIPIENEMALLAAKRGRAQNAPEGSAAPAVFFTVLGAWVASMIVCMMFWSVRTKRFIRQRIRLMWSDAQRLQLSPVSRFGATYVLICRYRDSGARAIAVVKAWNVKKAMNAAAEAGLTAELAQKWTGNTCRTSYAVVTNRSQVRAVAV